MPKLKVVPFDDLRIRKVFYMFDNDHTTFDILKCQVTKRTSISIYYAVLERIETPYSLKIEDRYQANFLNITKEGEKKAVYFCNKMNNCWESIDGLGEIARKMYIKHLKTSIKDAKLSIKDYVSYIDSDKKGIQKEYKKLNSCIKNREADKVRAEKALLKNSKALRKQLDLKIEALEKQFNQNLKDLKSGFNDTIEEIEDDLFRDIDSADQTILRFTEDIRDYEHCIAEHSEEIETFTRQLERAEIVTAYQEACINSI